MKKPIKVLSATAMAAALSVSALTPTLAAEVETQVPAEALVWDNVVLKTADGDLASLSVKEYKEALFYSVIDSKDITHIGVEQGNVYSFSAYKEALFFSDNGTQKEAFEILYKGNHNDEKSEIYPGLVKDGELIANKDEQPEDRLNETFFYNAA